MQEIQKCNDNTLSEPCWFYNRVCFWEQVNNFIVCLKKKYLFFSALLMDIIVLLDFLPQSCQGGSSLYQQMCIAKTFRHSSTERERTCIIKHGTNMLENKI